MKKLIYIVICLTVLFSCTGDPKVDRMLDVAEADMDANPDSVYNMLAGKKDSVDDYTKAQRMKFYLLLAMSQNKTDRRIVGLDTMTNVLEYYSSISDPNNLIRANYMVGSIYRDNGDVPMALKYYYDGVYAADTTDKDCDLKTLSRVYSQMAVLYHLQRSPRLELEMRRKASDYAYRAKDTINAIVDIEKSFGGYYLLGMKDSALYITKQVYDLYIKQGCTYFAAGVLGIQARLYIELNEYSKAKQALDEYENLSGYVKNGKVTEGREMYYLFRGNLYEGFGKTDSAIYYYRLFLSNVKSKSDLEEGYKALLNIYDKQNNADSIIKYSRLMTIANDSANIQKSSEEITRMQSVYNYNKHRQIAERKESEARRYRNIIVAVIGLMVVMALIVYLIIHKKKVLRERKMVEINENYSSILNKYLDSQKELDELKANAVKYYNKKEAEVKVNEEEYAKLAQSDISFITSESERNLLNHSVVRHFHGLAAKAKLPMEQEWDSFEIMIKEQLPVFYNKISSADYSLDKREQRVCMLVRIYFIPTEISTLMGMSRQSVTNIRSKINLKLFNTPGTNSLDYKLRRL